MTARALRRVCMLVRNPFVRDARVLREAKALAEAGYDVTVIASAEPGLPSEEHRDGFRVARVVLVPWWVRRVAGRSPFPSQTSSGARIAPAALSRFRPALAVVARDVWVTRVLTRAALATPADVYHAHDLNTLEAAIAAANRHRARLVYDAHELYPEISGLSEAERTRWRRIERASIGRADGVITVSDSLADELVKRHGITRPAVLRNVPDRMATAGPESTALAPFRREGSLLVLYTGGLTANRGIEALVDAASRARGWHLVIMGFGPLEQTLRARNAAVQFAQPVEPEHVVAATTGADVGVIPYLPVGLNNAMSLPNKLFDYVQAGVAVAASDLVELRRFIESEGVGVVFEPGDADAIASALDGLAADPSALERMKSAARDAAPQHVWEREKRTLLDVYENVVRAVP